MDLERELLESDLDEMAVKERAMRRKIERAEFQIDAAIMHLQKARQILRDEA